MATDEVQTAIEMLADAVDAGVVLFDAHDRVAFVNPAACELLGVPAERVMGLSSHNVFVGFLRARPDELARLRTGEHVAVSAGEHDPQAFDARFVTFPARAGQGEEAGFFGQAPPTAIVLSDRRPARRLRRLEDARARLAVLSDGHRERHLLRHRQILHSVLREMNRARRDHDPTSVVVVSAARETSDDCFADWLTATLRAPDRAGELEDAPPVPAERDLLDALDVRLAFGLPEDRRVGVVLLPGTNETGAHAVALRLTSMARDFGIESAAVGVGTWRSGAVGEEIPADEAAHRLLARAFDDGDIERRAPVPGASPQAA